MGVASKIPVAEGGREAGEATGLVPRGSGELEAIP
jgi:hypothetical protein